MIGKPPNPHLEKTIQTVQEDWNRVAGLDTFRHSIADGIYEEQEFIESGKHWAQFFIDKLWEYRIPTKGKRLIEIGCGAGRLTQFLAPHFEHIYAMDISAVMLQRFRDRLGDIPNVTRLCAPDLSMMPEESADIIFSFLVFQHNPEEVVEKFFADGHRVLRSGGHYIFQLTIQDAHTVTKSGTGATDMVRWTQAEIERVAKRYKYKVLSKNPKVDFLKVWQK